MTPRLLLNSTKPKDYARNAREEMRGVWCVCVLFSTPLVFIVGRNGVKPSQPMQGTNEETPRALVEAVGPTALVGRPVGRSACPGHQPPPTSSGRLSWASLSDPRWGWPVLTCLNWVLASLLVHLSLNRCSDIFYDFMSGQSVLATCI